MKLTSAIHKNKGFSLVELMVTVAVIGILAAIGIPNYQKFRAKSYQAEAKTSLATLYTAQAAFYFEYNGYHSSLDAVGYLPSGKVRYNVGFGSAGVTPASYTATHAATTRQTRLICAGTYGVGTNTNCEVVVQTPGIYAGATVAAQTYLAAAMSYEDQLMAYQPPTEMGPLVSIAAQLILGESSNAAANHDPNLGPVYYDSWVINEQKVISPVLPPAN